MTTGRAAPTLSRRRFGLWAVAGAVSLQPACRGAAQSGGPPFLVGYLRRTAPIPGDLDAFRNALGELGAREGRRIAIEQRYAHGDPERLRALAAELVAMGPSVLLVDGPLTVKAAMEATQVIPIVFALGGTTESIGITSLSRPNANATGVLSNYAETSSKRMQILKEILPGLERLAVLSNPTNPFPESELAIREASKLLALETREFHASSPQDWPAAFAAMRRFGAGALLQMGDATFASRPGELAALAAKARLPAIYSEREFVDAGGLLSYGANLQANWRRAASYVDRILRGAKPGDLPIEQAALLELVVNLKSAQALGITIPSELLARANEVIE